MQRLRFVAIGLSIRLSVFGLSLGLSQIMVSTVFAADWQRPDYIRQAFVDIALNNEYDKRAQRVRKWLIPINLHIEHRVADEARHQQLVQMHVSHLQQITGHPIALVPDAELANVHLVFTRQVWWQADVLRLMGPQAVEHLQGAVCIAHMEVNARSEITRAFVVIPVDQANMQGKLLACVVEELTQIMGLPNDSDAVFPSIFNDKTPETLLTGLDGVLLELLYSRELLVGMTAAQAQPVITQLLGQWQADGHLALAEKRIRQGQLYPLLGYR